MKDIQKLKALEASTGFSSVFSSLIGLLKNIMDAVGIPQLIAQLNEQTMEKVKNVKEASESVMSKAKQGLKKISDARTLANNADEKIRILKEKLGLLESDFEQIIETNPLKSLSFLLLAVAIILLDYLVGGIMVFQSNQSPFIAGLLMLSAIAAAYFFYLAGPSLAVGKRMRGEIKKANHELNSSLGAATRQQYKKNPEFALPNWMRPSEGILSHNEGDIYYDGQNWILKRNQKMAWIWIGMGTFFSFLRLLPVLVDPTLYGQQAILWQLLILTIALVVNAVILFLELWRRKDSGLPNAIQNQVNQLLKDQKKAQTIIGDGSQEDSLMSELAIIIKNTNELLDGIKKDYHKSFDNIVLQGDNFNALMTQYEETYNQNTSIIEAFYAGLEPLGFSQQEYKSQIPDPSLVKSTYLVGNQKDLLINADIFKLENNV